jgi:holo-[acyl-carrier protein] synthase
MTLGIGVDLVYIPAFLEQWILPGSTFAKVFTAYELRMVQKKAQNKAGVSHDARSLLTYEAPHLAARWAAKEAFVKAWSNTLFGQAPPIPIERFDFAEVEVFADFYDRPAIRLFGKVKEEFERQVGCAAQQCVRVSLSHDGEYANSYVVIMG